MTEDLALTLGLIFRTLAPMRSREKMRTVIEGIEAMEREETAYWLGMAMQMAGVSALAPSSSVTHPTGRPPRSWTRRLKGIFAARTTIGIHG